MDHRIFLLTITALAVLGVATTTLAQGERQLSLLPVPGPCQTLIDGMAKQAHHQGGLGGLLSRQQIGHNKNFQLLD